MFPPQKLRSNENLLSIYCFLWYFISMSSWNHYKGRAWKAVIRPKPVLQVKPSPIMFFLPYKYFVFIDQSKNFKFLFCRKFKGYGPGNINLKTCVINYPDDSIQQYFRSDLFTAFPSCRFLGLIPGLPQRLLYIYSCKSLNKSCPVALFFTWLYT